MNIFAMQVSQQAEKVRSADVKNLIDKISKFYDDKTNDIVTAKTLQKEAAALSEKMIGEAEKANDVARKTALVQDASVLKYEADKLDGFIDAMSLYKRSDVLCANLQTTAGTISFKKKLEEGL